jgi:hypothetical protein
LKIAIDQAGIGMAGDEFRLRTQPGQKVQIGGDANDM